jgi:hypothetical protein
MVDVHGAAVSARPGYRDALVELSVIVNSALTANVLRQTFATRLGATLDVVYGVYHLRQRIVGLPAGADGAGWVPALAHPPRDEAEVVAMGRAAAASGFVVGLLGEPTVPRGGFVNS